MGERSKIIGEIGEDIVSNFFKLIGWENSLKNQSLPCIKSKKHSSKSSKSGKRSTHGIDFLHSYKTPLEVKTIENVIISVKHTEKPYSGNPKAKFRDHIEDLVYSMECFKNSELKNSQIKNFTGVHKIKDTGLLFWLSSADSTYDNVIEKVSNLRLDKTFIFDSFHVIDNRKISFIYDTINHLKTKFHSESIEFFYPDTSLNYADTSINRSGTILPVEYLTSPIIPIKIISQSSEKQDIFCISCLDEFDEDNLKRLIQAATEYTNEINCEYLFLFPNYISSQHSDSFYKAKVGFPTRITNKINIESYRPDFRSLNNG